MKKRILKLYRKTLRGSREEKGMRGSIKWQVQELFFKSGINSIGESKHKAKEIARNEHNAKTWHEIGKKVGIHSYATADAYRDVWKQIGNYAKTEFKVRDMEKLNGSHIQSFLESKTSENVAHATFMQYAAAAEKLESALNGFAKFKGSNNNYDFSEPLKMARKDAHVFLSKFEETRAYDRPKELVANIGPERHALAAKIQLEGGGRVSEVNHLKWSDLKGMTADPVTNTQKGEIRIEKGKGGKSRNILVQPSTYNELRKVIADSPNRMFKFSKNDYRKSLENGSKATNQEYNGSHGLRWNFAQFRFQEVQRHGLTYDQALTCVSQEMGHERADITEHYLKN